MAKKKKKSLKKRGPYSLLYVIDDEAFFDGPYASVASAVKDANEDIGRFQGSIVDIVTPSHKRYELELEDGKFVYDEEIVDT